MKASSVSSQEPFNPFGLASKFGSFVLDNASNKANSYCQNNIQLYFDSKYSINKANVLPFLSLTSPRGGSWKNLEVFNQFNKFIRLHCEKIPLGFASLRVDSRESNGLRGDENNLLEGEGLSVHGARSDTPKKVLILMSDTGGGHRASAEAIKAAFYEQFGDEYQVFVVDLWTEHTPWPFNQLPRSYNFLVKHGTLWKMTYYASAPRLVHQTNFAATSTFIAR
ncbi:glycosyltransferase [Lithospermum erythrorhizon]|uniref:Glycosyltransferase n=1 Tax=Lithospermum erythrorhizon TaxID=34254 RepID=A0AAV3QR89_LITER